MIIDRINLNHLRIFESVYRTLSMTHASRELHLTQSGVSQHIKALEDSLEIKLFDRLKQRLVPTNSAHELYKVCDAGFKNIETAIAELRKSASNELSGTVHIGMPIEFGNNVVLPLLARFGLMHPRVKFSLKYGFATEMNEAVLGGTLDFAFIDEFTMDRRVQVEKVFDESLYLCATADLIKRAGIKKTAAKFEREDFEKLHYVDYQSGEPVLQMWFRHHLKKLPKLNVRATVMDVQGVARLILEGLGAGVLPQHLFDVLNEKNPGALQSFKGCGRPLQNTISLASLTHRTASLQSRAVFDYLKKAIHAAS